MIRSNTNNHFKNTWNISENRNKTENLLKTLHHCWHLMWGCVSHHQQTNSCLANRQNTCLSVTQDRQTNLLPCWQTEHMSVVWDRHKPLALLNNRHCLLCETDMQPLCERTLLFDVINCVLGLVLSYWSHTLGTHIPVLPYKCMHIFTHRHNMHT